MNEILLERTPPPLFLRTPFRASLSWVSFITTSHK